MTEWCVDKTTNTWYVLLFTQLTFAAEGCLNMQLWSPHLITSCLTVHDWPWKTKAAAGEVSQSACALTLEDMHKLHQLCLETPGLSIAEYRWGVVRHVSRFCYSILFLKTDSHTWRQFISLHGYCCWGLRKLSICSLKALTFILESVSSLLYSVAWWIVTSADSMSLQVVFLKSICALVSQHRQASPTPGSSMQMTLIHASVQFVHSYDWQDSMVQTVLALAHCFLRSTLLEVLCMISLWYIISAYF